MIKAACKLFVFLLLLTGVIYPLVVTIGAQLTLPYQANGSLLQRNDKVIGSLLIAQNFHDDRYFWPRPSAIDYDPLRPSGGSNLGPISKKLRDLVTERKEKYGAAAPAEMLFASGSGLDPHISVPTAYFQIPRVAKARSTDESQLKAMIDFFADGQNYVNVLQINLHLDGQ